jgi:hypothetical protein
MRIENKTVLITGANRGIGQALVEEALERGARRVYAGTRGDLENGDERVTPLTLDVTDTSQIQRAANRVEALDVLINNAGIAPLRRPERSRDDRSAPGRQPLGSVQPGACIPAAPGALPGSDRQQPVGRGLCPPSDDTGLLHLQGRGPFLDAVLAGAPGRPGCEGPRRPHRPSRYRHVPGLRRAKGLTRVGGTGDFRRRRKRRRRHLSRSHVAVARRELAYRRGKGAREAVRGARSNRPRQFLARQETRFDDRDISRPSGPRTMGL